MQQEKIFSFQLTTNSPTILTQLDGALSQFPTLLAQSQQAITTAINQIDADRVSQLLALVQTTKQCLNTANAA